MSGKKIISVFVAAAVLLLAASYASGCGSLPDNAAVKVNDDTITKDQVTERIRVARGLSPSEVPADQESEDFVNYRKDVTQQLVWEKLIRQEADRRDLTVSDEEIEAGVQSFVEDKFLGDAQKMEEQYSLRGISMADLRADIAFKLMFSKVRDSLLAEVEVTDDEVKEIYDKNVSKYIYPERRQVRQIVTTSEADAQAALTRINNSEEFVAVASEVTVDSTTKKDGGLVGLVTRDTLPPAVADVAFSLGISGVSQPFNSDGKWYIVKVELISPASNLTFEDMKEELTYFKKNQKYAELFKEFKTNIYDTADIEYADDYAPREEEAPVDTGTTPGDLPAGPIDIP